MSGVIRVSAVVLLDGAGRMLTVRKRGTARFMLPGGKPEPGESAAETAVREVREEIGLDLDPAALEPLGAHRAAAANEAGLEVEGAIFLAPAAVASPDAIRPAAEIEELRWMDPSSPPPADLAPLLAERVLPALAARR